MDELNRLHGDLPSFIRIMCVGAELAPVSFAIAIADGVTVAAHSLSHSRDHLNPCLAACSIATNSPT